MRTDEAIKAEKALRELLSEYNHYKCMTAGFFAGVFSAGSGMNLYDFLEWLNSRK